MNLLTKKSTSGDICQYQNIYSTIHRYTLQRPAIEIPRAHKTNREPSEQHLRALVNSATSLYISHDAHKFRKRTLRPQIETKRFFSFNFEENIQ